MIERGSHRFILAKPVDVPTLVQEGVADAGVAGGDVLEETGASVLRLRKLGFGKCRMALAGPGTLKARPWVIATKYPNIGESVRRAGERIVVLNGSVELAPNLGLSDVILDLVETGNTLRANGLEIIEVIQEFEAELIANPSSFGFNRGAYDHMVES